MSSRNLSLSHSSIAHSWVIPVTIWSQIAHRNVELFGHAKLFFYAFGVLPTWKHEYDYKEALLNKDSIGATPKAGIGGQVVRVGNLMAVTYRRVHCPTLLD